MNAVHTAFVALGSNLDEPVKRIARAIEALGSLPGGRLVRASSLYRTAPVGLDGQPDFINAVAMVETHLDALSFFAELIELEQRLGRQRSAGGNGSRHIDIDLLLFDDETRDDAILRLPHPRMHLRAFVLVPLHEIAPDCLIPGWGSVAAWLPAVAGQVVEKLTFAADECTMSAD